MAGRLPEKLRAVPDSAALGVGRRNHKTSNTSVRDRPGAHNAGFERNIERCVGQAIIAKFSRTSAQRPNFSMRRRIVLRYWRVSGGGQNGAIGIDQHCPDGRFVGPRRLTRFIKGKAHEFFVVEHRA